MQTEGAHTLTSRCTVVEMYRFISTHNKTFMYVYEIQVIPLYTN